MVLVMVLVVALNFERVRRVVGSGALVAAAVGRGRGTGA